jgi:hypothetical protein
MPVDLNSSSQIEMTCLVGELGKLSVWNEAFSQPSGGKVKALTLTFFPKGSLPLAK